MTSANGDSGLHSACRLATPTTVETGAAVAVVLVVVAAVAPLVDSGSRSSRPIASPGMKARHRASLSAYWRFRKPFSNCRPHE